MNIVLFTGPSLPASSAPGMTCLPPAERGSVYLAARQRPDAIGIIDGYFDQRIAVWHKEILWALEAGIPVYGAASMGALRAAELAPFGMIGVGKVFGKYHSGEWMDDDEVAVAHADQEHGYRPLSDAMANIRFTLERAEQEGVVSRAEREGYVAAAKAAFYPERSLAALLGARPHPVLAEWLKTGRVDQKREDALELVAAIRSAQPRPAGFVLERSVFWDALEKAFERRLVTEADRGVLARLGDRREVRAAAMGWWAMRNESVSAEELIASSEEFCARHGIADIGPWLEANRSTADELGELLAAAARAARAERAAAGTLDAIVVQYLRWTGEYSRLNSGGDIGEAIADSTAHKLGLDKESTTF
jgi:hypothetical protein